jgi:hypothetical protein
MNNIKITSFRFSDNSFIINYDEELVDYNSGGYKYTEYSNFILYLEQAKEVQAYLNSSLSTISEQKKAQARLAQLRRRNELKKELEELDKQLKVE